MPDHKHDDSILIDLVGAPDVARAFELTPQRLYNWRMRGVPARARIRFAKLAAEKGVAVPQPFLDVLVGEAA